MAEPSRLLKVLASDLPLSAIAGRGAVPQDASFFVLIGVDAYGYAFANKAAALVHWRAQAGYVSDAAISTTLSAFVFTTDAGYIAGVASVPPAAALVAGWDQSAHNGNVIVSGANSQIVSTCISPSSALGILRRQEGRRQFRVTVNAQVAPQNGFIGIGYFDNVTNPIAFNNHTCGIYGGDGHAYMFGVDAGAYFGAYAAGDVIDCVVDFNTDRLAFALNGVLGANLVPATTLVGKAWHPIIGCGSGSGNRITYTLDCGSVAVAGALAWTAA